MSNKLLFDLISKAEGTHQNYNTIYGINKTYNLTIMTIDQVLKWQKRQQFSAAGKYQIIRDTLLDIKRRMKLSGNELFDEEMQDKMALRLLNDRGYQKFLNGKMDIDKFMLNLAKEWASFPIPKGMYKKVNGNNIWLPAGVSYYDHDGVNHSRVTIDEVKEVLTSIRPIHQIDNDIVVKVSWWSKLKKKLQDLFS